MKKTSRIAAATFAALSLFGLAGCTEITAQATVLDNDNAVFVLEQRLSSEALQGFSALMNNGALELGDVQAEWGSEQEPTEAPTPPTENSSDAQALCDYLTNAPQENELFIQGSEVSETCDEQGYRAVITYPVQYDYTGITAIGDNEISSDERRELPFNFSVDAVYDDVVFEHDILGLNNRELIQKSDDWSKLFTDYTLQVSFPGEVTGFSDGATQVDERTVAWDYEAIRASVGAGEYKLSAAGRADYKVDPFPIVMTIVGVLFLLMLLVYFMWKRFPPKTIIVASYCLALLGPFGMALALVAKQKSRNNADGASQAIIAIWVTSAIFIFEVLVIALLIILAPNVVTELLASMGLASSAA